MRNHADLGWALAKVEAEKGSGGEACEQRDYAELDRPAVAICDAECDRGTLKVAFNQKCLALFDREVGFEAGDAAVDKSVLVRGEIDRPPDALKGVTFAFGPAERIARQAVEVDAVFYELLALVADLCAVLCHPKP